jgi:hypothetical protein
MPVYTVQRQSQRPQQFQLQLDGVYYLGVVYWLAFGQRYYIRILDSANNTVLNLPLISSDYTQNLLAGYFTTSTLTYSENDGVMVVTE